MHSVSAGGVIVRKTEETYEVLLLRDLSFSDWTLPKGHQEEWETLEEAALREVYEEAWVKNTKIISLLGSFKRHVKKTGEDKTIYYFLMVLEDVFTNLERTHDNEWFELAWHDIDNLPSMYLEEQLNVITDNISIIKKLI